MSGKSRRKRGKQPPGKNVRGQQRPAAATRVPAVPTPSKAATQPEVAPTPATVPLPQPAKPQAIQFPYIATELRTIGVLAGIMAIILFILYFTLV